MNNVRSVLLIALVLPTAALAVTCPAKEYAQYKDQGGSATGRRLMAIEYCAMAKTSDSIVATPAPNAGAQLARCQAEMDKIVQVFVTTRDTKAFAYANARCPATK